MKKERVFVLENLEQYVLQRWGKPKVDRETVVFDEDLSNISDNNYTNGPDEFHPCPRVAEEKTKRRGQGTTDEPHHFLSRISHSSIFSESICNNCNNSRIQDEEALETVCCCSNPVDDSLNELLLELAIEAQCSVDDLVDDFGSYILQQIW
jgi:hypothetical protein